MCHQTKPLIKEKSEQWEIYRRMSDVDGETCFSEKKKKRKHQK